MSEIEPLFVQYLDTEPTRRYGSITSVKELKRLFFIGPILLYVAELFGPEDSIKIVVEEDLNGVNVKANGHFEFMLKRNNKYYVSSKPRRIIWSRNGPEFGRNGSGF